MRLGECACAVFDNRRTKWSPESEPMDRPTGRPPGRARLLVLHLLLRRRRRLLHGLRVHLVIGLLPSNRRRREIFTWADVQLASSVRSVELPVLAASTVSAFKRSSKNI